MAETAFFITGATGLLGTEIVRQLLTTTDSTIRVVVRAATASKAAHRLQALWWEDELLSASIGQRVIPVTGDITREDLALFPSLFLQSILHTRHLLGSLSPG